MRAAFTTLAALALGVAVACGRASEGSGSAAAPASAGAPGAPQHPDAGVIPDGGRAEDPGSSDAGSASDAGPPTDAGSADAGLPPDGGSVATPALIDNVPCPAPPQLLWSRTFPNEVDFRGVADDNGNLYWVEYDRAPGAAKLAPAWLVSGDRDGGIRYRVAISPAKFVDVFAIAYGKVLLSNGAVLTAYDAATGAASWSIDERATYAGEQGSFGGLVDLGTGKIAFAGNSDGVASGLHVAEAATGSMSWSMVGASDLRYALMASDGEGHILATAHRTSAESKDLFVLDATGHELWSENLGRGYGLIFAWLSTAPWLWLADPSPAGHYVAVPPDWYAGVMRGDSGFTVISGTRGWEPVSVAAIRDREVIAQGVLAGTESQDGVAAFPFLAGEKGDHLLLVAQQWYSEASMCQQGAPGPAALWRFDKASSYHCPFNFDFQIDSAALLDGRLVLGRRTSFDLGCPAKVPPTIIEAYGVPGESLAPSGWVQRQGSPGRGMRPRSR